MNFLRKIHQATSIIDGILVFNEQYTISIFLVNILTNLAIPWNTMDVRIVKTYGKTNNSHPIYMKFNWFK